MPSKNRIPSSLKVVFFACSGKSLLEVRTVRLRKSSPQPPEKYDFKVLRILTAKKFRKIKANERDNTTGYYK